MNAYVIRFEEDCGPFNAGIRSRTVIANSECEAKRKLFDLLHERAAKRNRILHYIDVDFWNVDCVIENYAQ